MQKGTRVEKRGQDPGPRAVRCCKVMLHNTLSLILLPIKDTFIH